MARRRRAERRDVPPDPKYGSVEVARLITKMMMRGKKSTAQRIIYGALDALEKETKRPAMDALAQSIRNATPLLQVKPRRVGGATYQVPVEVPPVRGQATAMRWLIDAARARKGMPMERKLSNELLDAFKGEGAAVKRREDLHRMAEANRAFVHYRW